ncbi:MAG: hypothetical protein ACRDTG_23030 [Pseudonocardiaceae bacterium]
MLSSSANSHLRPVGDYLAELAPAPEAATVAGYWEQILRLWDVRPTRHRHPAPPGGPRAALRADIGRLDQ